MILAACIKVKKTGKCRPDEIDKAAGPEDIAWKMSTLHYPADSDKQAKKYARIKKQPGRAWFFSVQEKPGCHERKGNGGVAAGEGAVAAGSALLPERDKLVLTTEFGQFLRPGPAEMILEDHIDNQSRSQGEKQDDKQCFFPIIFYRGK